MVDDQMRTSDPAIFAAGDVAEHDARVYGLWSVASEQAQMAAANSCGVRQSYAGSVVSIQLKLAGITLISIGSAAPEDEGRRLLRGGPRGRRPLPQARDLRPEGGGCGPDGLPRAVLEGAGRGQGAPRRPGQHGGAEEGDWSVLSDGALDVAMAAATMRHERDPREETAA